MQMYLKLHVVQQFKSLQRVGEVLELEAQGLSREVAVFWPLDRNRMLWKNFVQCVDQLFWGVTDWDSADDQSGLLGGLLKFDIL